MSAATAVGPIGARQINGSLYVGQSDLTTIQKAVDWARNTGGAFTVVIPAQYTGSDTIAAVAGGTGGILVLDLRNGQWQSYTWGGAKYVPGNFAQLGNLSVGGSAAITGSLTVGGNAIISGAIEADQAAFAECSVAGSPVLTEANFGEAPGIFPPAGIGVSTGSAWGASINPADVPRLSTANTFALTQITNGQFRAYGWTGVDLTKTHAKIGTNNPLTSAYLGLTAATAPVDQKVWLMVASPTDLHFTMTEDGGTDHIWLQVERSGASASQIGFFYPLWFGSVTKGLMITPNETNNYIDFQGETQGSPNTYNQAINLNRLGGVVNIGPGGLVAAGDIDVDGDLMVQGDVAANDASFATCEVDGSPVRTFANSGGGGGGGMVYPDAGIGVSTGSAWGVSINPATLATYPAAGIAVSTGAAWGAPINPATLTPYPPAGVPQSTGAAWRPASIPMSDDGTTTTITHPVQIGVTAPVSFTIGAAGQDGHLLYVPTPNTNTPAYLGIYDAETNTYYALTSFNSNLPSNVVGIGGWYSGMGIYANVAAGANANPIFGLNTQDQTAGAHGIGHNMFNVQADGVVTTFHNQLDSSDGSASFGGELSVTKNCQGATTSPAQGLKVTWNLANGVGETDFINSRSSVGGGFYWFNVASNTALTSATTPSMILDSASSLYVAGGINFQSLANRFVGAGAVGFLSDVTYLDCFGAGAGRGNIHLRVASSGGANLIEALKIDSNGDATFSGNVAAATKSFRIPHPMDKGKDLMHSCLEGPEIAVFYRGEVTTKKGTAEVTLPDYFEKLTLPGDRTVLLTQVFETATDDLVFVAASRVIGGKFKIRSGAPSVRVAWEVKAIRSDQPRLEVTIAKQQRPEAA